MRLTVTVVSPATGRQADVAIEAGPGTTLAQVAGELDRLMHGMPAAVPITGPEPWVPALFVGGHRVPGDMRLAGSPLLDGCVVSLGDPSGCPRPEPPGVAELRVAGGPAAGGVYRLVPGMTDIGGLAADDALVAGGPDIEIADPAVSPLAMRVIIGAGGWQLRRSAACRSWWTGSRWTGPIAARWQAGGSGSSGSSGGGSTRAVIGACYDGPFGVDLRQDGPHALIARTTGAGKSELLQTMIASLACANRPDEMTFVLVDYKGGSAFSGCAHLPHVTGLVTDLASLARGMVTPWSPPVFTRANTSVHHGRDGPSEIGSVETSTIPDQGARYGYDSSSPDDHRDARAVPGRAHRFRTGPLEDLPQQR